MIRLSAAAVLAFYGDVFEGVGALLGAASRRILR